MSFDHKLPLELQVRRLSIESSVLANVTQLFRSTLPDLVSNLQSKLSALVTPADEDINVGQIQSQLAELNGRLKQNKVSFTIYEKTLISVPEGFKGNLVKYFTLLANYDSYFTTEILVQLNKYRQILLTALSTDDMTAAPSRDSMGFVKEIESKREQFEKDFRHYFDDNGMAKARLGVVIDRFADLTHISQSIIAHRRLKNNAAVIQKATQEINDLLTTVIERSEAVGNAKINPDTANLIGQGAYSIAKQVEAYAVFQFRWIQADAAYKSIVEQLNELFKA